VIENYRGRTDSSGWNTWIKSIVDPARVERCRNPHCFLYVGGARAVDENHRPIDGPQTGETSFERLRINHYATKSVEEWHRKLSRPMAHSGRVRKFKEENLARRGERLSAVPDDTITAYLPALRDALGRVGVR
jgi:hypothetical protein